MRVGLVSYADDPEAVVFRVVILQDGDPDGELDDPRWWVEGIDPTRPVRMDKVGIEPPAQRGVQDATTVETELTVGAGITDVVAIDPGMEIVETVIVQPGEKTWTAPQSLIDAMARLKRG